jgi:hypothetical protein
MRKWYGILLILCMTFRVETSSAPYEPYKKITKSVKSFLKKNKGNIAIGTVCLAGGISLGCYFYTRTQPPTLDKNLQKSDTPIFDDNEDKRAQEVWFKKNGPMSAQHLSRELTSSLITYLKQGKVKLTGNVQVYRDSQSIMIRLCDDPTIFGNDQEAFTKNGFRKTFSNWIYKIGNIKYAYVYFYQNTPEKPLFLMPLIETQSTRPHNSYSVETRQTQSTSPSSNQLPAQPTAPAEKLYDGPLFWLWDNPGYMSTIHKNTVYCHCELTIDSIQEKKESLIINVYQFSSNGAIISSDKKRVCPQIKDYIARDNTWNRVKNKGSITIVYYQGNDQDNFTDLKQKQPQFYTLQ